jgi:FkbM family methyltransferase
MMKKIFLRRLLSIRDHHFCADLLGSHSVVVDLGACFGEFSAEISRRFGCMCYAVEASPRLFQRICAGGLVKKFNYAIAKDNGPVSFFISENPEGSSIVFHPEGTNCSITVDGITLEALLKANQIQSIDLLKVDIEGAETQLFGSMSDELIREIKQITVEFHDFKRMGNLAREVREIKRRLISLGFLCLVFSVTYNKDVLFINNAFYGMSRLQCLCLRLIQVKGKIHNGMRRLRSYYGQILGSIADVSFMYYAIAENVSTTLG